MNTEQKMTFALAQLARSSRTSWDQFINEYRVYCDDLATQLISSPKETLELAQGRARQARELLKIFENCLANADQMERKK